MILFTPVADVVNGSGRFEVVAGVSVSINVVTC